MTKRGNLLLNRLPDEDIIILGMLIFLNLSIPLDFNNNNNNNNNNKNFHTCSIKSQHYFAFIERFECDASDVRSIIRQLDPYTIFFY